MSGFELDWMREERTGVPEAVLCSGKSAAQIAAIAEAARLAGKRLLFTRIGAQQVSDLPTEVRALLEHDPLSNTAVLGRPVQLVASGIGIVCAGTSDLPVATEAQRTLQFLGHEASLVADVGVAGLWRLLDKIEDIRRFRVIIAVAGMEGALFSVLAGLLEAPVIAVPTSVGYGVAEGGRAALSTALASCAPGVVTVNIDNGFGAAAAALKILRAGAPRSR